MPILKVNLIPPKVKQAKTQQLVITIAILAGLGLMSVPISYYLFKRVSLQAMYSRMAYLDEQSTKLNLVKAIAQLKELEQKEADLAKNLAAVSKLVSRQSTWIKILETISVCQSQTRDLWLTSIKTRALAGTDAGKTEITIDGRAYSFAAVLEFRRLLEKSELQIEFGNTDMNPDSSSGQTVVKYTVRIRYKG